MTGELIAALIHILFGALWVGGAVSFDLVVMSTIRKLRGSSGEPLEMEIPLMEKALKFFFPVAIITIASGLIFLYIFTGGDLLSLPRTLGGAILTLGIFLGVVVFIMGIYIGVSSSRMINTMKRVRASHQIDPGVEMLNTIRNNIEQNVRTAKRIEKVAKIEMILMVSTAVFMILSAYT